MRRALSIVAAACLLAPSAALAHTGAGGADGVLHGLMHPVTGLDHLLAALLGGRALWLVPASFVAMAAAGGLLGARGAPLPLLELGISASVIVLGLAIALQAKLPIAVVAGLAGLFGIYHGYAHGAEMPATASGVEFGAGFLATTAVLHLAGIGLGLRIKDLASRPAARFAQAGGVAMALVGAELLMWQ